MAETQAPTRPWLDLAGNVLRKKFGMVALSTMWLYMIASTLKDTANLNAETLDAVRLICWQMAGLAVVFVAAQLGYDLARLRWTPSPPSREIAPRGDGSAG